MALAEARKLVSNRLAETKKYAPEAKKVAQQEFQARREDWWFAGNLASSFKLLYSSHGCLAFFFWEPKLEHTNISDTCSKWAVQGLFYIYTDTLPSRTLIYECCLRDFLNPSPSPSDHRRQQGAQRQAMEKRLSESSKRLQPLRKFRQAFRGLLVCGALWSRGSVSLILPVLFQQIWCAAKISVSQHLRMLFGWDCVDASDGETNPASPLSTNSSISIGVRAESSCQEGIAGDPK